MSSAPKQGRERLDQATIVKSALALVDRDGLEGLSMRKLGRELAVEAMALYHSSPSRSTRARADFTIVA